MHPGRDACLVREPPHARLGLAGEDVAVEQHGHHLRRGRALAAVRGRGRGRGGAEVCQRVEASAVTKASLQAGRRAVY